MVAVTKTNRLIAALKGLEREEAAFERRINDLDQSIDKAIEVLSIPEDIADDLLTLSRLIGTTDDVLVGVSVVPGPVGVFARATRKATQRLAEQVDKAKDVAVKFDKKVEPTRTKLEQIDETVSEAADTLADFRGVLRRSRVTVATVKHCMKSKRLDTRSLERFSARTLPTVEAMHRTFVAANKTATETDEAIDRVEAECRKLIPIREAIDAVTDELGALGVVLDPVYDALHHKVTVRIPYNVRIKGKWYEPWDWKIRTQYMTYAYSVGDILDGIDGVMGAVQEALEVAAKEILKPFLGDVDLSIELPQIEGLDTLPANLTSITASLDKFTARAGTLQTQLKKQAKAGARLEENFAKLQDAEFGVCRPGYTGGSEEEEEVEPEAPSSQGTQIDTTKTYRLTTQFVENSGLWLEGNGGFSSDNTLGGAAFMSAQDPAPSGTMWKFVDAGDGYYRMTTLFVEPKGLWLEGNGGFNSENTLGGAAFMSPQDPAPTGTLWKIVPAGNGYFRLTTLFVESKGLWLEGNGGLNPDNTLGGAAFMSPQDPAPSGTLWKFVPVE